MTVMVSSIFSPMALLLLYPGTAPQVFPVDVDLGLGLVSLVERGVCLANNQTLKSAISTIMTVMGSSMKTFVIVVVPAAQFPLSHVITSTMIVMV